MKVLGPLTSGAAVGANGEATAHTSTEHAVSGQLLGVYVKYNDSPPNTTDVVIATIGTDAGSPPAQTLLTLTNKNADGWFFPRIVPDDATGVEVETPPMLIQIPFSGRVDVLIDDANANDSVSVWLFYED
jgi:hypothetical protein